MLLIKELAFREDMSKATKMTQISSHYYGLFPYAQALQEQQLSYQKVIDLKLLGHVIGCEHPCVVTAGKRYQDPSRQIESLFPVYKIERGGELALHTPGQLVIYPIVNFKKLGLSTRDWVYFLQTVTQQTLAELGLPTHKGEAAGLWSTQGKVMFMGLRIKGEVSLHGLAINIHNDLSYYDQFVACGVTQAKVDRLQTHQTLEQVFQCWTRHFLVMSATGA